MILNKAAVDRGLAHGTIFKTETVNLKDDKGKTQVMLHPQSTPPFLCSQRQLMFLEKICSPDEYQTIGPTDQQAV